MEDLKSQASSYFMARILPLLIGAAMAAGFNLIITHFTVSALVGRVDALTNEKVNQAVYDAEQRAILEKLSVMVETQKEIKADIKEIRNDIKN